MEVVQVFNDELQSLLDTKPPVSKAKMGLITRAAMKGVKFYKHIVQSVEKFIAKCRPEYKVPGLYVIDSIVRQSRHQFGIERDVYAVRFSRNLPLTFDNLFSGCPPEDKNKIVRVLNLWQKNGVFSAHVIQPLLDMADSGSVFVNQSAELSLSAASPDDKHAQTSKYLIEHFSGSNSSSQFAKSATRHNNDELKFNKNILDFDYDEEDSDGDETPTEAEPPLSSTLSKIEMERRTHNQPSIHKQNHNHAPQQPDPEHHQHHPIQPQHHMQQPPQKPKVVTDPVLERWNRLIRQQAIVGETANEPELPTSGLVPDTRTSRRSRSKSPPALSNQSVTRENASREQRPIVATISNAEKEAREAEREAERQRKCLPKMKDRHLTVCSSTLWLGHVPKTVSEADISDAFGEYGTINSINLIPPRGCAYVCMDRRQDAKRALNESKNLKLNGSHVRMAWAPGKGFKEYKKFKDFWEVDVGASFIPYSKIDSTIDFDTLEDGGVIDEDSMSMELCEMREKKAAEKKAKEKGLQPGLSLPLPTLPILSQPPPFSVPPPNINIPPPTVLGAGASIPFPPPIASSSSQMAPQIDLNDSRDLDKDTSSSPISIDQQISMTERQINMVEQQLNMIQQAQGISQAPATSIATSMHSQAIFQPTPIMYDMHGNQMIHPGHPMIDPMRPPPTIPIFTNAPPVMGSQLPHMIPMSQAGLTNSIGTNPMMPFNGRY